MKKSSGYFKTFSLTLSVGLAVSATLPAIASIKDNAFSQGSGNRSEIILGQRRSRLEFKVRGIRPSMSREGGISASALDPRANCAGGPVTVTALLPKTNEGELAAAETAKIEIENTIAERPTFFVHVSQTSAQEAEFILKKKIGEDKYGQPVYDEDNIIIDQTVALPKNPGIVSISLPADAAALEVGQLYFWAFQVICDPTDRSKDVMVEGAVQRIELDSTLANQLKRAEPRDRPVLYADAGIWTDAVSTLFDLRKANPNDAQLRQDWEDLLKSVGLDTVAQATLIGSVSEINRN
jgi:hypothetical protein